MNSREHTAFRRSDFWQQSAGSSSPGYRSETLPPEAARLVPVLARSINLGRGPSGLMSWLRGRRAPTGDASLRRMARQVAGLMDRSESEPPHASGQTALPGGFDTVSPPNLSNAAVQPSGTQQAEQSAFDTPSGKQTILLAEDNAGVRNLVRHILRTNGYELLEARHGQEALRVSDNYGGAIDLLITDMIMPQMDGSELAHLLATRRPGIKILFLSGQLEDTVPESTTPMKSAFLQKPFKPADLVKVVQEMLGT